jgi:acyl-CoA thioester hydrolase/thioesterase-3
MISIKFPSMDAPPPNSPSPVYSRFESELTVRPDDIDMNQHVHASKYFDYVLAARYDQMARCYRMSMEAFLEQGLGWFVRVSHIEHKRPLKLGERFIVRTWIAEIMKDTVKVGFEILKMEPRKIAAEGYCSYTLVKLATGRAEKISPEILARYSI